MLQSLLGSVTVNILEYGYEIGLNWLGKFAQAIIEGVGILGLGIIVFTIVLKAITLPFDIYQRISMRKQNLIMREMQPELEKLQKQYANDKTTYNQKMMELYKKNGYSMLGACLPMILSLVILIVAFQGFRTYSQYANLAMYENMAKAYSQAILTYGPESKEFESGRIYLKLVEDGEAENLSAGKIVWEDGRIINGSEVGLDDTISFRLYNYIDEGKELKNVEVTSSDEKAFISYTYWIEQDRIVPTYSVNTEKFDEFLKNHGDETFDGSTPLEDGTVITKWGVYNAIREEKAVLLLGILTEDELEAELERVTIQNYVSAIGANAAANWYRDDHDSHFLWVKNVWYPDVAYNQPIQKDYKKFQNQLNNIKVIPSGSTEKQPLSSVLDEGDYGELTAQLDVEKNQPNGYFILIILSIGFMVLSQFITMRSSKESNKYQTVDGQGARTQKMMLVIMPLMYAVFAFMYSAAFSIYMTMSSVIALLTTLLSNLIIGKIFKKKEEEKAKASVTRKYAWQMTEKEKRAKEKEAKKEAKMNERANRFKNRK